MKSTNLFLLILIITANLNVNCQRHHIQRILARKQKEPPDQMFNMFSNDNVFIMQRLEFSTHDMIFMEAVEDFLEKLRMLADRTNELQLTHDDYVSMINITVSERNREQMQDLQRYFQRLFNTRAVLRNNVIYSMHPMIQFAKVTELLRKWMFYFKKDAHLTKNRDEFYAKMKLNTIKDSIGFMKLFYYYYDSAKFYPNLTFNLPRYKVALYKRIEQEMPYINTGEYY